MYTICETSLFSKFYSDYWTEKEYNEFKIFLASNPEVGDVEPNSGGIRKVRWGSGKTGKNGGVRVIYYNRLANGQIWLLTIYGKSAVDQLDKKVLRALVEKLNESLNDIVSRDAERDIGAELLMAVDEMLANAPVETYTITQTDVALARQKSELSQREFAETLGVSVRTLESWEQGVRKPSKAAQSLIKLFIKDPSFVREALS